MKIGEEFMKKPLLYANCPRLICDILNMRLCGGKPLQKLKIFYHVQLGVDWYVI